MNEPDMSKPRIIFAGTPDFSVGCLSALLDQPVDVVAVYTQPDRVAGRGKKLQQSPVKQRAIEAGIEVFQPENFKSRATREALAALHADLMVVVAYGLILPQSVLDIPQLGCINVHASLLPRWRGAAPIQRAIEAGDSETGVCLMQMEKGLDTGPVLACSRHQIAETETGGQLHDALAGMGAQLLARHLGAILDNNISPVAQADAGMSYAHKLDKSETRIDWQQSARQISNKIRAFNPWPVMATRVGTQVLRLHRATALPDNGNNKASPGEVLRIDAEGIDVQTGDGYLKIEQIQKPGGKILSSRDFLNGFKLTVGQRFE